MFELTALFFYKLQFMAELLIVEVLLFGFCKKGKLFILRLCVSIVACMGFALIIPILGYDVLSMGFLFLSMAVFSAVMMGFCYKEKLFTIVFITITAYAVQHLAHQLYELVVTLTGANEGIPLDSYSDDVGFGESSFNPFSTVIYCFVYIVVYNFCFFLIGNRYIKHFNKLEVKQVPLIIIASIILMFAIVLSLYMTYSSYTDYVMEHSIVVYAYDSLSCILALYILYDVALRERLAIDYNTISHLYRQEQEQFLNLKENIEVINLKYHDLKHQVRKIGKQRLMEPEAIKDIEDAIKDYDLTVVTGNEALDIILTDKSLTCSKKSINLLCMVDGQQLDFMIDTDIYSLFGNLTDNAIEAVETVPMDKRSIGVNVRVVSSMISISVHNYYDKELVQKGNDIVTSKKDKNYHGFGLKSIKKVCEKYGGKMVVKTENNIFNTNILIPIPSAHNNKTKIPNSTIESAN